MENNGHKWLVRIVMLFMAMMLVVPASGQGIIKRKKKSTATTTTKTTTNKKRRTTTNTNRNTRSYEYDDVDSVAVVEDDDDTPDPIEVKTKAGFTMYGIYTTNFTDNADGQKDIRESLNNTIKNSRTAYLTDKKACVIYGNNGYTTNGLNSELLSALKEYNNAKHTINDVAFTDNGYWCVIYGDNGWKGAIPKEMQDKLNEFNKAGETISSISICENGNFAVVTDKHFYASHENDMDVMKLAGKEYGHVNSVCITDKGIIVTCENGMIFLNVPNTIIERLKEIDIKPVVVRFTDSSTYIAIDADGRVACFM